ncbi:hypothetical protein [Stutzerimonas xanthomarina]|uniref:Uncharacterized protein n=2 Tax=Stutzerimonas xanthomarina TaxID=271420 RepID=A0A1M5L264_9GAMM|nr:hypothetical protein [Stutzerimonas xanthomarina]MCP9337434.1 hypothetical protein [Stutzerimonas xanthomarina]SEH50312.1 hypothetical protein SAMN05216535_0100 [Stutzerimonas xanthomarina]SHG59020.1 hypothetical protein SAMN02744645_0802 [Stutzerimonas xanthomarina DSM 18231]
MNRQARFLLVGKGFLTAAVVTLIMGAEQPSSEPFSRTQHESAERIHMYDAQPVGIVQTGPAPQTIDYLQGRSEQRWVF